MLNQNFDRNFDRSFDDEIVLDSVKDLNDATKVLRACVTCVQRARSITRETVGEEIDGLISKATGARGVMDDEYVTLAQNWDSKIHNGSVENQDALNAVMWLKRNPVLATQLHIVMAAFDVLDYYDNPVKLIGIKT